MRCWLFLSCHLVHILFVELLALFYSQFIYTPAWKSVSEILLFCDFSCICLFSEFASLLGTIEFFCFATLFFWFYGKFSSGNDHPLFIFNYLTVFIISRSEPASRLQKSPRESVIMNPRCECSYYVNILLRIPWLIEILVVFVLISNCLVDE
jgi:hypothetical protein